LKKLGSILLYTILCIFVYFISFNILVSIANVFKTPLFRYGILIGVPVGIAFVTVHRFRVEKGEIRRAYLSIAGTEKIGIKSEWRYMIRFPEFIAENIAFATVILPFLTAIGIANPGPWWANILAGVVILCIGVGAFFIIDFLLWMLVHVSWRKA
jgi:hypothetical protein